MLHTVSLGRGPDLVMLHGWAMHGGILRDFAERLAGGFRVTLIDLPGHGRSPPAADTSLAGWAASILESAPPQAHWLGWSLGAALSLRIADTSAAQVRSLTLMAGTPRFAAGQGWPGVEEDVLGQFARELRQDYQKCLQRFLGLQVRGLEDGRASLKTLRARIAESGPPDFSALDAGLAILRRDDLREALARLRLPVLAVFGRRDRLVPAAAAEAMARLNAGLVSRTVAGATHLPFWTHREEVAAAVEAFLRGVDE